MFRPRPSLTVALTLLTAATNAQHVSSETRWHDTELAELRQPSRTTKIGLRLDALTWFHPFDPVDWARLSLGDGLPVQLIMRPPVELVSWIDHESLDDPARRAAYRRGQAGRLSTPAEVGWDDEAFQRLASFGITAAPPRDARVEQTRAGLKGKAFIGRVLELQHLLEPRVVLVEGLEIPGMRPGGVTLWEDVIAINVSRPADTPRWWHAILPPATKEHVFTRTTLETYVHELGHVFWFTLTDAERSAFEAAFWPEGDRPAGVTVSRYARTNAIEDFAESFKVAVLYPTTYDTEPVHGRDVLRPWTNTPMPASAIERVRHVDRLITSKTGRGRGPTTELRDNRFSRMLEGFAPEDGHDDEPNLLDALNKQRGQGD